MILFLFFVLCSDLKCFWKEKKKSAERNNDLIISHCSCYKWPFFGEQRSEYPKEIYANCRVYFKLIDSLKCKDLFNRCLFCCCCCLVDLTNIFAFVFLRVLQPNRVYSLGHLILALMDVPKILICNI